uniref:RNA-directed RNA polymerase catalytic subunit n=1 Tax=Astopletus virus TaxID=2800905 RepID=A0A894KJ27_9VIRU|nr:MAG: polymerase PB1 [Astopletus virus]
MTQQDPFDELPNSMWSAMFNPERRRDIPLPSQGSLNTLGMVSALYLYTNPPPYGCGTPAPKVAETVLRSIHFNHNPGDRLIPIGKYLVDNPMWASDDPFPFHEIGSDFHGPTLLEMSKSFLVKNFNHIVNTSRAAVQNALVTNSDVLTKGKQTWDPFTESSVPCPQAYTEACEFFTANGKPSNHTLLEFLQYFFEIMGTKNPVKTKKSLMVKQKLRKKHKTQFVDLVKSKKSVRETTIPGSEAQDHCIDLCRSFCSYIKHAERGHLTRRAIASPNVFLRGMFHVIEDFHLKLGEVIDGSTISIGGERKKAKIATTMEKCGTDSDARLVIQATQDATKWNECLSAAAFGVMSHTFFSPQIREELRLPEPSFEELVMLKLCLSAHFILAIKMITLGDGLQGTSSTYHGSIPYTAEGLERVNANSKGWFEEILPLRYGNNYINAPGGMLMGMHNALSTTFGLLAAGHDLPMGGAVNTLRSSDDSMTMFTAPDTQTMEHLIGKDRENLRAIGINLSSKKTLYFQGGFGEYTSWYQDSNLVSQYGTETSKLRPGGNNPPDDFYTIAKSTSVSLMGLESNPIGAEARIRLGIENVRSLYRIKRRLDEEEDEDNVSCKVRVLSDGGLNPWNATNCHLEETCLKEKAASTEIEKMYLLKIRDPRNPFSGEPKEDITWSKEAGTLVLDLVDTPRTMFHYVKRANASVKNVKGKTHAEVEKDNALALDIATMADISTLVRIPTHPVPTAYHVAGCMETMSAGLEFTDEEKADLDAALARLRYGVTEYDSDDGADKGFLAMEDL